MKVVWKEQEVCEQESSERVWRSRLLDVVEILDDGVEDVLWIRMQDRSGVNDDLTVAVCYLPPKASSHGGGVESMLLSLVEQVKKYRSTGRMVICGDFNGRCGGLLET